MRERFEYSVRNPKVPVAYAAGDFMHTLCEMILPYISREEAEDAVKEAWDAVRTDDEKYNRFRTGSLLWEVNSKAASEPVELDEDAFMALEFCKTFNKATKGWFDISANPSSRSGGKSWILDPENRTVSFGSPETRLDLGGFAKGYALEKVVKILRRRNIDCAFLSFGGSSVSALGAHPYGEAWPMALQHPYFPRKSAWSTTLKDTSLSVSGKDPRGRGHIIDPFTGNTVEKDELITVTGPSPMVCEVLSTALWLAPWESREGILGNFPGYSCNSITPLADGTATNRKIGQDDTE
jgi:thiamine biosynthesis lipoprotein